METTIDHTNVVGGSLNTSLLYVAAACAFVSQAIHLWVLPGEMMHSLLPGLFFLGVAIGQGLLGVSLLFNPGKQVLRFGILLNISIILVWGVTHLMDFPNLTGHIDHAVGILEIAAGLAELILVLILVRLYRER